MTSRLCLITGASRGLGAHLARRFWNAGWSLVLVARDKNSLISTCSTFEVRPSQSIDFISCDLASNDQINKLLFFVKKKYKSLDLLINNAAIQGPIGCLEKNNFGDWIETLQINLLTPILLCKELTSLLKYGSNASIINLSGGGASGPRPNFSSYASSKAALVRFSETIAEELKVFNISVNCIAPGVMKTNMLREILVSSENSGERELELAKKVLSEGGASMDRVSDLALFLVSDVGTKITGKLISAVWDNWEEWPNHIELLNKSDVYTLRRITGRDRGFNWGDK